MVKLNNIQEYILSRQKETRGNSYINLFAVDDKKKEKNIISSFYDLSKRDFDDLIDEFDLYNIGSNGVFININPLKQKKRIKANIKEIHYVFIDLDDAQEQHNILIKENLKKFDIEYCYNAKSGHGFHFLIPVSLNITEESKIKGFLTYLRNNICEKVDLATSDNTRLMRFPESMHHKDETSKKLITLEFKQPSNHTIEKNTKLILEYQEEQKKGVKDEAYMKSLAREDLFFSTLLNQTQLWSKYAELLNSAQERNNIFIKNLGCFLKLNLNFKEKAIFFINSWEPSREKPLIGWKNKAEEDNMNINYFELLKWAKNYDLKEFICLLENQLRNTFLDEYEIYYLEDEKKENSYLMYYPEKNYYVQKPLCEVLQTIYYDTSEKGINLEEELGLINDPEWAKFNFKKKIAIIFNTIHQKLDSEKRIKMVFNINYEPSEDKFIYINHKKYFNTYNKSAIWDYYKKEKDYHFPHIKELLDNLTGEKENNYEWFIKWLAWQIQNPKEKLPTAVIFQGRQGSGKGTFKKLILDKLFGGSNVQEINQTHLESSFNEYLMGKQIIVANEVMHNENRQTLPGVLKNLVTDPEITISRKFRKEIKCENYTHWIFCTNNDNPIKIDEDDRRYSVFYSEKLKGGGKAAAKFIKTLMSNLEYEIKAFMSFLKSVKVEYYDVHEPIMTEAKKDVIDLNKDSIQRFMEYLQNFKNLEQAFNTTVKNNISYHTKTTGMDQKIILVDTFYLLYRDYCEKFGERGIYNKQSFSRKLIPYQIKSGIKYIPEERKNFRAFDITPIENFMEKQK